MALTNAIANNTITVTSTRSRSNLYGILINSRYYRSLPAPERNRLISSVASRGLYLSNVRIDVYRDIDIGDNGQPTNSPYFSIVSRDNYRNRYGTVPSVTASTPFRSLGVSRTGGNALSWNAVLDPGTIALILTTGVSPRTHNPPGRYFSNFPCNGNWAIRVTETFAVLAGGRRVTIGSRYQTTRARITGRTCPGGETTPPPQPPPAPPTPPPPPTPSRPGKPAPAAGRYGDDSAFIIWTYSGSVTPDNGFLVEVAENQGITTNVQTRTTSNPETRGLRVRNLRTGRNLYARVTSRTRAGRTNQSVLSDAFQVPVAAPPEEPTDPPEPPMPPEPEPEIPETPEEEGTGTDTTPTPEPVAPITNPPPPPTAIVLGDDPVVRWDVSQSYLLVSEVLLMALL